MELRDSLYNESYQFGAINDNVNLELPSIEQLYPLSVGTEKTYCLFVNGTQQAYVTSQAENFFPCRAINPIILRRRWSGKTFKTITLSLMPGYVFIFSSEDMEPERFRGLDGFVRVLQYADGDYALRDRDEQLARWLLRYDGTIGLSRAVREGDRIRVVDGPLKDIHGVITKADKHRRRACIEMNFHNRVVPVWLDYDLVELDA